ncbi:hypothetical protein [Natronorubrum tibetense]|uniref:ArsR family transcriptional regulator n=1 Tax=Natronorubrum tibetense GA33 TaxID=1114856 RepID=L9W0R8_9EURY|nr:hypothetical protein [Natronorubrum tibetense]ELY42901.1 hypothetical protein C496_06192 [Natronorubrum tibetense GA33]
MASIHDNLFTALADPERRQILFDLADEPDSVNIDSPPDTIANGGNERFKRYHVHLPMLDDYGFINWYPNANAIESGPQFDEIMPVLEVLVDHRKTFPATSL